ncbi:MAG: hypothetical protein IKH57_25695 [Clostridia bacterium]|nr:hypothetical protein [Clostridia bacterium]
MTQLEIVLNGIEEVKNSGIQCPLENVDPHWCCHFPEKLIDDIVSLLKAQEEDIQSLSEKYSDLLDRTLEAQEPRVMALEEVIAQENGTVLWVEESQNYVWNVFPLEVDLISKHPDTGTFYIFFIAYHDLKKFEGDEYGLTWRCWTARPTDEQRKVVKWE